LAALFGIVTSQADAEAQQLPGSGEGCLLCQFVIDIFGPVTVPEAGCGLSGVEGVGFTNCNANCQIGQNCTCVQSGSCTSALNLLNTAPDGSAILSGIAAISVSPFNSTASWATAKSGIASTAGVSHLLGCADVVLHRSFSRIAERHARTDAMVIRS
jgi:hypothetical protein